MNLKREGPPPVELPAEFDLNIYRSMNSDLAGLSDVALIDHYRDYGRDEGRVCNEVSDRTSFLSLFGAIAGRLEIGPFDTPLLDPTGADFADVLDTEALKLRALELGRNPDGVPAITWVCPNGDLSSVSGRYELVLSCHSVEHSPDLVRHLNAVEQLLNEGGRFAMIVPDSRYCFDHFLAPSTIADVLDAWDRKTARHSLKSVIEHMTLITHNVPSDHWQGIHGGQPLSVESVQHAIDRYLNSATYIDVHAWQFTPSSFNQILTLLNGLGLIRLEVERVYPTQRGQFEFFSILRLPGE